MTSKILSMAVALVIGAAAINAGPAAAGPIGSSPSLDVASPNLVLEVKGNKIKPRKRLFRALEAVRTHGLGPRVEQLEPVRRLEF